MQAKNGSIIITVIIFAVLLGGFVYMTQPDEVVIPEPVAFPTAAEIAALIVVPAAPAAPEIQDFGVIPGTCRSTLKDIAEIDAIAEVNDEMDDLKDFIEDTIANFDEFVISPILDDSETDITIDELGYCEYWNYEIGDEEDNKEVIIIMEYDFSYENTFTGKEHKDTIYVTAIVEYDEGNFNDKDIELTYSL